MAIQIEEFKYPKYYSFYTEADRRGVGARTIWDLPDYYYGAEDFRNATLQTFHFDFLDGDPSQTYILCTYRNGVKVRGTFVIGTGTDSEWNINVTVDLVDVNDNRISNYIDTASLHLSKRYYTANNLVVYYSYPQFTQRYNTYPDRLVTGGKFYTAKYLQTHPYDPAPIELKLYDRREFQNQYYIYDLSPYNVTTTQQYNSFINLLKNNGDGKDFLPIDPSDDTSHTGGGDANGPDYNPFSDTVDFPDLPSVSALTVGLIKAYNPSSVQLNLLANKLWSDDFFDEIKKINNDPMEAVISLHMLPFNITPSTNSNCIIGNYDSEISMPVISQQFMNISGGSFQVNERFASALDYSPYTTVHMHIPFVGIVPLDIDYIMKKTISVNYQVDVLTGSAVAMVKCDNALLYVFPCNMAMTIPLTSSNHQALYREVISTSAQIGHTIVAGASGSDKGGNARVGHGIVSSLESALNTVASKHSEVQKSGAITGTQGILDSYDCYLIFHRPIQSLANNFAHFKGFPCNITYTLSSLTGYTEIEYAHLEGVTATDAEKDEIQTLLQAGVIL